MNAKVMKEFVENTGFANIYTTQKTTTSSGLTISVDFVPQVVMLTLLDAYSIWIFPSRLADYGIICSDSPSVARCTWGTYSFTTTTINSYISVGITVLG